MGSKASMRWWENDIGIIPDWNLLISLVSCQVNFRTYLNSSKYNLFLLRVMISVTIQSSLVSVFWRFDLFEDFEGSATLYRKESSMVNRLTKLKLGLNNLKAKISLYLDESEDIKAKWGWAVNWLNEELERGKVFP